VVDQLGVDVGVATEPFSGLLVRRVGNDSIFFFASPNGPVAGPLDFYHATDNCSDSRYLQVMGGAGFVYFASVRGGTAFYTKTMDPTGTLQIPILAVEHFEVNEDATQPGTCNLVSVTPGAYGVLTTATDPALANLALPLRLK
jgi:hypothetical protein